MIAAAPTPATTARSTQAGRRAPARAPAWPPRIPAGAITATAAHTGRPAAANTVTAAAKTPVAATFFHRDELRGGQARPAMLQQRQERDALRGAE